MAKPTAANSSLKKAILPNLEVSAFFNFKAGLSNVLCGVEAPSGGGGRCRAVEGGAGRWREVQGGGGRCRAVEGGAGRWRVVQSGIVF